MNLIPRALARSREKLDLLYLYNHKACDQQIGKVMIYYESIPPIKSKKRFENMVTWDHMIN